MTQLAKIEAYLYARYKRPDLKIDTIAKELLSSEKEVRKLLNEGRLGGCTVHDVARFIVEP